MARHERRSWWISVVLLAVTLVVAVTVTTLGRAIADRARAQSAADATALAGARAGRAAALRVAAANEVSVTSVDRTEAGFVVQIERDGAVATAAAETVVRWVPVARWTR